MGQRGCLEASARVDRDAAQRPATPEGVRRYNPVSQPAALPRRGRALGVGSREHAQKARTRLLREVDEQQNARTRATVDQLLDRDLVTLDVGPRTRTRYERSSGS